MHERFMDTLPELTSEDFDAMMQPSTEQPLVTLPYGMDVVIIPPETESAQALHCGIDTGDGDGSEDEYPPVYDPTTGSVDELY